MPELPEVETIRSGLSRLIKGKTIQSVESDYPKSFPNSENDVKHFLIGSKIKQVRRRGKALLLDLSSGYTLIVHLKMTGQLVYTADKVHYGGGHPGPSLLGRLPDKSTRVILSLSGGSRLYFNDVRKFGWMRLYPTLDIGELDFFKKLGPDPLEPAFSWQQLRERLLRRSRSSVKAALMDQTVIAGIGNIYADESLWGAKIHPQTTPFSLKDNDYRKLYASIKDILKLSLDKGGSTDRNYVNAEGGRGSYLEFARVFRRQGQPCPRCGTTIIKIKVAGRGTHLCPSCQKIKQPKDIMKST